MAQLRQNYVNRAIRHAFEGEYGWVQWPVLIATFRWACEESRRIYP